MAERRHPDEEQTATAVVEAPIRTDTEKYYEALEDWEQDARRLAVLRHQPRLTSAEVVEKLTLEANTPHKLEDVVALEPAMEAEMVAVYAKKKVAVWNEWTTPQIEARERLLGAMFYLLACRDAFVTAHEQEAQALSTSPGAEQVELRAPSGQEAIGNFVPSDVAGASVWRPLLLASQADVLSGADLAKMRASHVTAQPKDVRHVLQATQRRGRR